MIILNYNARSNSNCLKPFNIRKEEYNSTFHFLAKTIFSKSKGFISDKKLPI
jgi:hypothetical protein